MRIDVVRHDKIRGSVAIRDPLGDALIKEVVDDGYSRVVNSRHNIRRRIDPDQRAYATVRERLEQHAVIASDLDDGRLARFECSLSVRVAEEK